jgi:N4-bis(aminopropyl)spermidine synthase
VQLEVQRAIMEAGLEIRSLTRDFNDYVGAGVLGGTSHLYHLTMTAGERPPAGPFYTGGRSGQAVALVTCSESVKPSG